MLKPLSRDHEDSLKSLAELDQGPEWIRSILDLNYIQKLHTMDVQSKSPGLLSRLALLFVTRAPLVLKSLRSALDQSDYVLVRSQAHQLISSAATLGLLRVVKILKEIDSDCTSFILYESLMGDLEREVSTGIYWVSRLFL